MNICQPFSRKKVPPQAWEPLNQSAAALSGSFAPAYRFENLEIHKVFLQFSNLNLEQNPSLTALAIGSELPWISPRENPHDVYVLLYHVTAQKTCPSANIRAFAWLSRRMRRQTKRHGLLPGTSRRIKRNPQRKSTAPWQRSWLLTALSAAAMITELRSMTVVGCCSFETHRQNISRIKSETLLLSEVSDLQLQND